MKFLFAILCALGVFYGLAHENYLIVIASFGVAAVLQIAMRESKPPAAPTVVHHHHYHGGPPQKPVHQPRAPQPPIHRPQPPRSP